MTPLCLIPIRSAGPYTGPMAKSNSAVLKRNTSTGKYVVAVPREVREKAGLKDGDSLIITTTQDGRIILRSKSGSLRDLRGAASTRIRASDQAIRHARDGKIVSTSAATKRPASTEIDRIPKKK